MANVDVIVYGKPHGIASAPLEAIKTGCEALGLRAKWRNPVAITPQDVEPCLFVAVVGFKKASHDVYEIYQKHNIPVMVCEYGYLKRGNNYMDEEGYYQLSWNGLNKLNPNPCVSDRFIKLGIPLKQEAPADCRAVTIAGQVPNDAQHGMNAEQLMAYYENLCAALKQYSSKEIRYRPHPCFTVPCPGANRTVIPSQMNMETVLKQAWAIVTYNSNIGHEALVRGVPVFCDKSAVYAELGNLNIADIERPARPPRSQYFYRLAYSQWLLGEMRSGEAVKHMIGRI